MTEHVAATIPPPAASWRLALFDYGFRPFYLLCGLYALAIVPLWLYRFAHASVSFGPLPGMYWHAHEMLFGFVFAAIAGFLLTAVPSWTGARGFAGWPLGIVVALWVAGRVAMGTVGAVPFGITMVAELALVPALLLLLAPPIFRNANRNAPLLGVLVVLWLIDAAFLVALERADAPLASATMRLAIDLVLVLVTVIGGRIVPAFTANALRRRGETVAVTTRVPLEIAVIGVMVVIAIGDVFAPDSVFAGALAACAAALHLLRLAGWRSFRTRGESILWVMHVAYAWLPVGLALKAAWLLGQAPWAMKWQHALTMGLFATMILAVMTRSALGHTGRPLAVSRAITAAYLLLTAGALARVFGAVLFPQHYLLALSLSGLAWVLCFLLFIFVYAPILLGPRADGKPG